MQDKLVKYVTMIDILGEPVSLRINKEDTAKTFIGGISTLFLAIGIFTIFWVFVLDVLYHINPSISVENRIMEKRPNITLTKETMAIAFGVTDAATGVIDKPEYFKFGAQIFYNVNGGNSTTEFTDLELKQCEPEDFPTISNQTFYDVSINYMYCIKDQKVDIFGFWDEEHVQLLSLYMKYCVNETETDQCASIEESRDFLKSTSFYFNIYIANTMINPQNYDEPITHHVINKYKAIRGSGFKILEIFVKNQSLSTDDTYLFNNDKRNNSIAYDYQEPDEGDITEEMKLVEFQLISSKLNYINYRIYKKVSEVLADVGGLSSLFFFSLKTCCYLFTSIKRDEEILNKIFDFDLQDPNDGIHFNTGVNLKLKRELFSKRNSQAIPGMNINNSNSSPSSSRSGGSNNSKIIAEANSNSNKNNHINHINHNNNENLDDLANLRRKSQELSQVLNLNTINKKSVNFSIHTVNSEIMGPNIEDENNPGKLTLNNSLRKRKLSPISEKREFDKESESKTPFALKRKKTVVSVDVNDEQQSTQVIQKILSLKDNNYKLKFSFWEILTYFICRCCVNKKVKHKFNLYNKSENVLDELLDVSVMIQKIDEMEKLKLVMLTKEQIALFNFISKDVCSLNKERVRSSQINIMREYNKDQEYLAKVILKFIHSLSTQNLENEMPEIDKKLFNLLHAEVKNNLIVEEEEI